jgi:nucleotide-binding universal stress UspA family protein
VPEQEAERRSVFSCFAVCQQIITKIGMNDKTRSTARPRKILLATDLSPRGDRALDRAAQLAAQWDAELLVLHAIESAPTGSSWSVYDELPSWRRPPDPAAAIAHRIRRDLREPDIKLSTRVEAGAPVDLILDTVAREGCDLVVLGTARDEVLGRFALGDIGEHLVRRSPVSVLIVKARPGGPYRHILVGTDFTEEARHGLNVAGALFPDAHFALMHAYDMPYAALTQNTPLGHEFATMEAQTLRAFLASTDLPEPMRARVDLLTEHGPPEIMLRKYAVEREADLTVIGAYGRGILFHLLVGGHARKIVDAASGDVLVVRAARP